LTASFGLPTRFGTEEIAMDAPNPKNEGLDASLISEVQESRDRFLAMVASIRPDLHRYCARMTGSVSDGEDVVQETLSRAYYSLPELYSIPPLRSWLFRIAHNCAIDYLRRYERRMGTSLEDLHEPVPDDVTGDAEDEILAKEAVQAAVARFLELPPAQRSCVILKDVLGHRVDEIATLLDMTVPAVKAALHRGREALRKTNKIVHRDEPAVVRSPSPEMARYLALFNAHDWAGVRAMLAEDVRLDLVSRSRRQGREDVSGYLGNYQRFGGWHLAPAWLDGREVIAAFRTEDGAVPERPAYFIEVMFRDGHVERIRDFRYVPYINNDAALVTGRAT
jgi:RNA polymerase sigma-70 factor (ECF subfamily)